MFIMYMIGIGLSGLFSLFSIAFKALMLSDIPPQFTTDELVYFKYLCIISLVIISITIMLAKSFKQNMSIGILIILILGYFILNYMDLRDFYFYANSEILNLNKFAIACYLACLLILLIKICITKIFSLYKIKK